MIVGFFYCFKIFYLGQSELFSTACRWFSEALRISYADSHNILGNLIELENLEENQIITEQGSDATPSLIMVLHGTLKLYQVFEYK